MKYIRSSAERDGGSGRPAHCPIAPPEIPSSRDGGVLSRQDGESGGMASDDPPDMGVVTLNPAPEIAYRRYLQSLADFAEAYEALASRLAKDPEKGRRIASGRRECHLDRKDKPAVGATYALDDGEVSVFTQGAS